MTQRVESKWRKSIWMDVTVTRPPGAPSLEFIATTPGVEP
jgi:hypothetical protein|nr:hypothetical protein JVH1_2967 [Rhodococcus sp. JVH1]